MNPAPLSQMKCIADIIRTHGSRDAGRIAIEFEGQSVPFSAIDERSSQVANALLESGVEPQQTVAFLDKNTLEYFDIVFGAAKAGAISLGINWRLSPSEMAFILKDAQTRVLFVGPEFFAAVESIEAELPSDLLIVAFGAHARWPDYGAWMQSRSAVDPGYAGGGEDVAFLTYTSGTTGLPKGAMMTSRGFFAAFAALESWRLDSQSVSLVMMPMFHFSGSGWSLLNLGIGARIVLHRDVDPVGVANAIDEFAITNVIMPPILIGAILSATPPHDLSSLRAICYGGSPIREALLQRAKQSLRSELIQLYGLTETAGGVSQLDHIDHDPANRPKLMQSCGKPFPWVELKIVDANSGAEIPTGKPGEIWVRAPQNMVGYWNNPEATSQTITPEGWLRTGDIGQLDGNGYLYLLDRVSDMIISGAENVYPLEVEAALLKHPAIAQAAVFGVPDNKWGEAVRAAVVRAPGTSATAEEIIHDTRQHLAGYKLPKTIDFVDELPRNATGKVLHRLLREPFWADHGRRIA